MVETLTRWILNDAAVAAANVLAPVMAPAVPVEAPPAPVRAPLPPPGAAATESEAVSPSPRPAESSPAAGPSVEKPTVKAEGPPLPEPIDSDEYRRIETLLYCVLEMLGGSQPFDVAVLSEAERIGRRLQREVSAEVGKEIYTVSELKKKGLVLRQKHDLARSLLQAVQRGHLALGFSVRRRELLQTAVGGMVTGLISTLCAVLAIHTVRIDSLLTNPKPHLLELLRASLNPESLVSVLGFQMIASLLGLFTVIAIHRCWRLGKELHKLRRALQANHMDPRIIARLV